MKVAILTTETSHHAYFVKEISKIYPSTQTFIELKGVQANFNTSHAFEDQRTVYENQLFFNGQEKKIKDFSESSEFDSINLPETLDALKNFKPEILVVFGTGKIAETLINQFPDKIINLHGGNPEEYRGLDTHLWAIYHSDYAGLVSCLHFVDKNLDTGNIISVKEISLFKGMLLHQLRAANTQTCVEMAIEALSQFRKTHKIQSHKQVKKGRYYSFMPSELKEVCKVKFEKYTQGIK